ncbi:MAG: portal protein [Gammaproteobacteria bacterium]
MRLPTEPGARLNCIREVLQKCTVSLTDRQNTYSNLRSWYLYGTDDGRARYNKLYPHIGTLAAYLYAQESTRFGISLGPTAPQDALAEAEAVADRLREVWHDSGGDALTASEVRWSLVYGCALLKFIWQNNEITVFGVDPGSFGVYREELNSLDRQEAVVHLFKMDKAALAAIFIAGGKSVDEAQALVAGFGPKQSEDSGVPQNYVGQLVVGLQNPIQLTAPAAGEIAGGITGIGASDVSYTPNSEAEVLELQELWIWDDETKDYRVVTLIEKDFVLFDRPNIFLKGELPFVPIVPDPLDDYFWGYSQVDALTPLQNWREKRMNQLDRLFQRQVNPPMVFSGFMGGVQDEKAASVMRRGGILANSQTPGAKVEMLYPQMPPEAFGEINQIDEMFSETIGLSQTLQGAAQPGVRSAGHASLLMQSGSGRLIRRALNIEAALERAGSLLLKMLKVHDAEVLRTGLGYRFIAKLFTDDCSVRISSHSSSPLFAGQLEAQALQLMELGIIDGDSYLDMTDPPMSSVLRQRLRDREQKKQQEIAAIAQSMPEPEKASFLATVLTGAKNMLAKKR